MRETGTNAGGITRVTADSLRQKARTNLETLVWEATSGEDELGIPGNDGRILWNIEGRFKQVSQEFCRLIGYEAKELIGKRIDEVTAFRTANIPQHLGAVVHFGTFTWAVRGDRLWCAASGNYFLTDHCDPLPAD